MVTWLEGVDSTSLGNILEKTAEEKDGLVMGG
jgi:hypothetical protein